MTEQLMASSTDLVVHIALTSNLTSKELKI